MAQFILPLTFVGQTSPRIINAYIHASPKGFPVTGLDKPLAENSKDIQNHFEEISLSTFYNKKIGISRVSYSPAFLDEQDGFLKNDTLYNYVASNPVVYMTDSIPHGRVRLESGINSICIWPDQEILLPDSLIKNRASIKKISANCFEITTRSFSTGLLALTQSYHHYWKVWIDGKEENICKMNLAFIGVRVPAGDHTVIFKFVPTNTIKAIWVMLSTIISLMIAGILSLRRKNNSRYS